VNQLARADGAILVGEDQCDGPHLEDITITRKSNNWETVDISDEGAETNVADHDTNQGLNGAQTIFGVSYASGTIVEAEFQFTVRDPDGNIYTLIAFNIREPNSPLPAYGTVEGLAFIGSFPPIGVPLTVETFGEGPSNSGSGATPSGTYATPPCFAAGTLIETPYGARRVETLQAGDIVLTGDAGPQPLRLVLSTALSIRALRHCPEFRPVRIAKGALGPNLPAQDILVSPQHQILLEDWRAALLFGVDQVLAPVKHLLNGTDIRAELPLHGVHYFHLLFESHQLVRAHGMLSESFFPGETSLGGLDAPTRNDFFGSFDGLRADLTQYGPTVRRSLRRHEARLLAA